MSGMDQVSMLILSCDLYEDAWSPYFRLVQRNWEKSSPFGVSDDRGKGFSL